MTYYIAWDRGGQCDQVFCNKATKLAAVTELYRLSSLLRDRIQLERKMLHGLVRDILNQRLWATIKKSQYEHTLQSTSPQDVQALNKRVQ